MELSPEWGPRGSERQRLIRAGRTYEQAAAKAATALFGLRGWIVDARVNGMTVTDIAGATGLSRPAVYRALHGRMD